MPASAGQTDAPKTVTKAPATRGAVAGKPKPDDEGLRYRIAVASRSLAAVAGGYLLANLFVLAFRRVVPMEARDASQLALMLSFIVFALVSVWVFAARDSLRAWAGVLIPVALCGALVWFLPEVRA